MSLYEITFSPTGGVQKVADVLAKALGQARISVDLTDRALDFDAFCLTASDVALVAVPSYGGRVPAIALSRLRQMRGGQAKAVLIAVYGNRAFEDTLLELRDTLTCAGFCCVAAVAAVAEHSIMRQFAAGRPDAADERVLTDYAEKIRQRLEAAPPAKALVLPGTAPYRPYGGVPMKPKAGSACVKCGRCAAQCPVDAISAENPLETDGAKCISCMRCVAQCPHHARSVSKLVLMAAAQKMKKACEGRKENELFL
ncbi:MAG: 4Fe-4S binding protein [Clostridia bacterium]